MDFSKQVKSEETQSAQVQPKEAQTIEIRGTTNLEMAAVKFQGQGYLQGMLLDDSGEPVPGATVEIEVHSLKTLRSVLHEEKTDAQGAFRVQLNDKELPFQISVHYSGSEFFEGTKLQQQVDSILAKKGFWNIDWSKYWVVFLVPLAFVSFRVWRNITRYKKTQAQEDKARLLAEKSKAAGFSEIENGASSIQQKSNGQKKNPLKKVIGLDPVHHPQEKSDSNCFEVSGIVLDHALHFPIQGAQIELISADQKQRIEAFTHEGGRFEIDLPQVDSAKLNVLENETRFFFKINQKGYAPFSTIMRLPHDGDWKEKKIGLMSYRTKMLQSFHASLILGLQEAGVSSGISNGQSPSLSHEEMVEKIIAAGACGEELRILHKKVQKLCYGPKDPTKQEFDNIERALRKNKSMVPPSSISIR